MSTLYDPYILDHPVLRALPNRLLEPSELRDLVVALAGDEQVWRPHVSQDPEQRWHARIYWTPVAEVYLLGWATDQDTRVHDHGESAGAFCVTAGELFEEHTTVGARRLHRRNHPTGTAVAFDQRYVHNLGNRAVHPAASVHAYSPPLSVMRFYERNGTDELVATYQLPVVGPEPDDAAMPTALRPVQ